MARIIFLLDSVDFHRGSDLYRGRSPSPACSASPQAVTRGTLLTAHKSSRRPKGKMFHNHGYVHLMNSETAGSDELTVNLVPCPLVQKMEGSRACAPSKSSSSPGSKLPSAWSTCHECPSFSREASGHPASPGHVSSTSPHHQLPRGTVLRQIRFMAALRLHLSWRRRG